MRRDSGSKPKQHSFRALCSQCVATELDAGATKSIDIHGVMTGAEDPVCPHKCIGQENALWTSGNCM